MTFGGVVNHRIGVFEERKRQHQPDQDAYEVGRCNDRHQGTNGDDDQRIGMEWIAEERAESLPERDHFGGSAQVSHGLAAVRAQRAALASVGVGHAAAAVVDLALAAVPFCGVAGMVVAIVFHRCLCPGPSENRWLMMTDVGFDRSKPVNR